MDEDVQPSGGRDRVHAFLHSVAMAADRSMDPFIAHAESLRRRTTAADRQRSPNPADEINAIRDGLHRLSSLSATSGDPAERTRTTSLLIGGLPPATRDLIKADLRELVERLPDDAVAGALESSSPHVRAGARVIDGLRRSPSPSDARAPRPALGPLSPPAGESPSAADAVLDGLTCPEAGRRLDAINALHGRQPSQHEVEVLLRLITDDPYGDVRVAAVRAFVGAPCNLRVAAAERALLAVDPDVHDAAFALLSGDDPAEVVVIYRLLDSAFPDVASRAADVLSAVLRPEVAVAVLWNALPGVPEHLQDRILERLRTIAPTTLDVLALVASVSSDIRGRSVALAALASSGRDQLEYLEAALRDPAPRLRRAALRSLARRWDARAFEAVAACRMDPRPDVRAWVVALLHGARDDRALPYLLAAAADPVEEVRRSARDAIRSMASGDAIDRIIRMLDDEESASTAEAVLADMGPEIVPRLVALLDDLGEEGTRRAGVLLRSSKTGAALRTVLRDRDASQRRRAAQALELMRGREAVPKLLELLDDPDPDVRIAVVDLIVGAGEPDAAEQLAVLELRELDPCVRDAIKRGRAVLAADDIVRVESGVGEGLR